MERSPSKSSKSLKLLRSAASDESGTSLIEMLVALLVFSVVVTSILPLMLMAKQQDRGARNVTVAASLATEIMETLRYYQSLANLGVGTPGDVNFTLNDPGDPDDYHDIDGTGTWASLGVNPNLFEMRYRLENDPATGVTSVRSSVRTRDASALNLGGGHVKWVEFTSSL